MLAASEDLEQRIGCITLTPIKRAADDLMPVAVYLDRP
jgi:hypothetical protein